MDEAIEHMTENLQDRVEALEKKLAALEHALTRAFGSRWMDEVKGERDDE
jgi:uncharacterized protein YceH (UPF0502 family)